MTEATKPTSEEPELPPAVARVKAQLEESTGKKFTYRPKEALPSIQHMLAHGAPEDGARPKTWFETARGPALLALLFCATFFLYIKFVPPFGTPEIEVVPETMSGLSIQERMRVIQQRREEIARMRLEKMKAKQSAGDEL